MASFGEHLLSIHDKISIKDKDREPYTKMFETISSWLMREMREINPLFNRMFKGTKLFGSYPNHVRIIKPSEFDVSILLELPYDLQVVTNPDYAGYARISRSAIHANKNDQEIFTENNLDRKKIRIWIEGIIESVLKKTSPPKPYSVSYTCSNVAHNFFASDGNDKKTMKIDFVPSIMIREENIRNQVTLTQKDKDNGYMKSFYAISQCVTGLGNHYYLNTFRLVNSGAEQDKIWDKQNLKIVYRLLKSIRDKHDLPRFKSYFFTAAFLWEVEIKPDEFWQKPVDGLLLHMLKLLKDYFERNNLPFYWDRKHNLLNIFKPDEIARYRAILTEIYSNLSRISNKNNISFQEVVQYFKTP